MAIAAEEVGAVLVGDEQEEIGTLAQGSRVAGLRSYF